MPSRYSPGFYPLRPETDFGGEIAGALESYMGAKRQAKLDTAAEEERAYIKARRERLDPLEEALLRGEMYGRGIVPERAATGGAIADELDSGPSFRIRQPVPSVSRTPPATGVFSPGSFNPSLGTFNPAGGGVGIRIPERPAGMVLEDEGFQPRESRAISPRIPLGGGFEIDPQFTPEGRRSAREEAEMTRKIDALVAAGVPREHAEAEARLGLTRELGEHLHDPLDDLERELGIRIPFALREINARTRAQQAATGKRSPEEQRRIDEARGDATFFASLGTHPILLTQILQQNYPELPLGELRGMASQAVLEYEATTALTEGRRASAERSRSGGGLEALFSKYGYGATAGEESGPTAGYRVGGTPSERSRTDQTALEYNRLRDEGMTHEQAVAEIQRRGGQ